MDKNGMLNFIGEVLDHMPEDWVRLTTHRLDIYNEERAKSEFLEVFETLYRDGNFSATALQELPTAYDYVRLGHPLSSVLEWAIAKMNDLDPENVISFSSGMMPVLAVLRQNLLKGENTRILYRGDLPDFFDAEILRQVYGYSFELENWDDSESVGQFEGSTILILKQEGFGSVDPVAGVDFYVKIHPQLGSVILVNDQANPRNKEYISEIQHVRRRESIAMTPVHALMALKILTKRSWAMPVSDLDKDQKQVLKSIQEITGTDSDVLLASSGLSIQYAIMMGLIHDANVRYKGRNIKFIVPPNCYGGTNDQARRVAAVVENVEIVDLAVDRDNDMVEGIDAVLDQVAAEDAVPYIIAEIPTNPRVEVPDLEKLKEVLEKKRWTPEGERAVDAVFILDQTFCPNVHFLGEGEVFSSVRALAYVSGSKFPSGGLCTAGYCVGNVKGEALMKKVKIHLELCDNGATGHQIHTLAQQMPSMNERIEMAYQNTRVFVDFIEEVLPSAKINFVSEELADQGFTPSVFSLDLPARGDTEEEREAHKRALNLELIHRMISEIPGESKFCVSYGQLQGSYWTVPATSTQGTTKEGDKDYIVRVSFSPDMDLGLHKKIFSEFAESIRD